MTTAPVTRRHFCSAAALAAAPTAPPNLILFYVDELRATALRLHNPDGVPTPNLERLARGGILFEHAFTPHPLCVPARVSLWSGRHSHAHGSRSNQTFLRDDQTCLAGLLHRAGYRLGIFGKNHCFTPPQLQRWFDADYTLDSARWKQALPPEVAAQVRAHRQWIRERGGAMMPPEAAPFPPEICETHLINQRAMEFIEQSRGGPFAAWISIPDPHHPIQTPQPFAAAVPPEKVKLPPFLAGEMRSKNTRHQIYDYLIRGAELPEDFLRRFLSIYYGMVAFIDHELGRLMALLERTGLLRNTILLFTSDHGDFAAEHHLIIKTGSLLDSMVRIPLVLSWPGRLPEGRRERALVSHVDLMPTLLELCSLAVPSGPDGQRLPLRPGDPRRSYVYSEYGAGGPEFTWEEAKALGQAGRLGDYALRTPAEQQALRKREWAGHLRMIRTATHKLILDSNGEREFY
ncbi:MAG: sulfatase-like hydrolase/transferase, partial [Armatimonadota bacterium]|nr:sulfatase-like hydrolase/transferase [Armatimonadota bacterium]